jgi:uncharacterized repeat protein (TIGR02543 family)
MRKHTLLAALLRAPLFMAVLCAALSVFTGCDDLSQSEESGHEGDTVYTVTFDANGGESAVQTRTVSRGKTLGILNMPSEPIRIDYNFSGWYTGQDGSGGQFTDATIVTGSITVYAYWKEARMPLGLSLNAALTWIERNAVGGGSYTITLKNDETIASKRLFYKEGTVGITLRGDTTERTVSLTTVGPLFTLEKGVTLILDTNVTLQGSSDNTDSLVTVSGGTLVMKAGSKITGNTASGSYYDGGGVYVFWGSTFTMNGGEISGNSSSRGGGVSVDGTFTMYGGKISGNSGGGVYVSRGTFTMSGGEISGNSASSVGGGVYVSSGTFTMYGGKISGNTASFYTTASSGGGVYVHGGAFTMSNGEISGNTVSGSSYDSGGGVSIWSDGTFTMGGGKISGNIASYGGGVDAGGTFTMDGGEISGNTASYGGGGVYVTGTFTMDGGEISGNTASSYHGGGVNVTGTFTKQGGTIYGSDGSELKNTAASGDGQAVYIYVDYLSTRIRNFTAGPADDLDSRVGGAAGGWE